MANNFTPVGNEVQVNLAPNQNLDQFDPDVAALTDGRFFVAFADEDAGDKYHRAVRQCRRDTVRRQYRHRYWRRSIRTTRRSRQRAGGAAIVVWEEVRPAMTSSTRSSRAPGPSEPNRPFSSGIDVSVRPGRRDAGRWPVAGRRPAVNAEQRHRLPLHRRGRTPRPLPRTSSTMARAINWIRRLPRSATMRWSSTRTTPGRRPATSRRGSTTAPASRPRSPSPTRGRFARPRRGGPDRRPLHRRLGRRGDRRHPGAVRQRHRVCRSAAVFDDRRSGGDNDSSARVAALPDGGFIVTWSNDGGIIAPEIKATTTPCSPAASIRRSSGRRSVPGQHRRSRHRPGRPAVAVNAAGQAFIAWEDDHDFPGAARHRSRGHPGPCFSRDHRYRQRHRGRRHHPDLWPRRADQRPRRRRPDQRPRAATTSSMAVPASIRSRAASATTSSSARAARTCSRARTATTCWSAVSAATCRSAAPAGTPSTSTRR